MLKKYEDSTHPKNGDSLSPDLSYSLAIIHAALLQHILVVHGWLFTKYVIDGRGRGMGSVWDFILALWGPTGSAGYFA
jgi:hypothetical protein